MKKYFTKYLPVEGEKIAVGEKYINLVFKLSSYSAKESFSAVNRHLVETRKKNQDNDDAFNGSKYSMKVRVKLFLCSRDIQVGDKPYEVDGFREDFFFKVIGEISPDALSYVKEGDEFDEEDWELNRDHMMPPYIEFKNKDGKFHYLD